MIDPTVSCTGNGKEYTYQIQGLKRRHKQSGWDLTQHLNDEEEAEEKKKKEDEHEDVPRI